MISLENRVFNTC